jgi:hypothetical protein
MIRVTLQTYNTHYYVCVTHVSGLKETKIYERTYGPKHHIEADEAIHDAVSYTYAWIRSDEPEITEHS